jgi:hypothetical protein
VFFILKPTDTTFHHGICLFASVKGLIHLGGLLGIHLEVTVFFNTNYLKKQHERQQARDLPMLGLSFSEERFLCRYS